MMRLQNICVIAILALSGVSSGLAQTPPLAPNDSKRETGPIKNGQSSAAKSTSSKTEALVSLENKNAMRITLKASRGQATAGSNFGITAEIENTSSQPIYIMPSAIAMTVPPELDSDGVHDLSAFIPGIPAVPGQDYWSTVIVLEPGSTTSAFWSSGNVSSSPENKRLNGWIEKGCSRIGLTCGTFLRGVGFSPGVYTLNVVGSYWDTYEGARARTVERHTQTAAIQETITAPQAVILLGAALGGIIAFLLLTKLQPTSSSGWASVKWIPGILSAVLLSMIVTILIARLSQSQFIISVTVNDLWGAIAVGFVITAAGPSILRKFTNLVNSPNTSATSANMSQISATTGTASASTLNRQPRATVVPKDVDGVVKTNM